MESTRSNESNANSIAQFLINKPSKLERRFHFTENGENVHPWSYYGHRFKSILYHVLVWDKLSCSSINHKFSFEVNKEYDLLRELYISFVLPAMRVKEDKRGKVKIRMPRKLGPSVLKSITMMINNKPGPTLNLHSLNIIEQYYLPSEHQKTYSRAIGDLSPWTEWTDSLPSIEIVLRLPFFFDLNPALAYPIFRDTTTSIHFKPEFESDIEKFLCYRETIPRKINGRTKNVYSKMVNFNNLLGISAKDRLVDPVMRGRYVKLTEKEMRIMREDMPKFMNIPVFESQQTSNKVRIGTTTNVQLTSKFPLRAIFWMAEGASNHKRGISSNYTTTLNPKYGCNPCHTTSIMLNEAPLILDFSSAHFEYIESRGFPSAPRETGYNAYRFGENKYIVDVEPGLDAFEQKAKLVIRLDVDDPYEIREERTSDIIDDEEEEEEEQDVKTYIRNPMYGAIYPNQEDENRHSMVVEQPDENEEDDDDDMDSMSISHLSKIDPESKTIRDYYIIICSLVTRILDFGKEGNRISYPTFNDMQGQTIQVTTDSN